MAKNEELFETKLRVIYTLHKKRYYNKRHTPISFVCKRISTIPCKQIKNAINELKKEQIIINKPTYHGFDVCLNVKMKKEIDEYLKKYLEKDKK